MSCNPAAAKAATQGMAAAAHASSIAFVQCQSLKYNVIIIGWLGVIMSAVMTLSSMMIINLQPHVQTLIKQLVLHQATDKEVLLLMNLLAAFSTVVYGLSLINLGVSLLLLIGVARDSSSLMYPWLIFHGVVFGVGLYLGIFYAMAGLFIDLSSFLMCLLVFALVLVINYKIYHDVFTLFRVMQEKNLHMRQFCQATEHAYASGMPMTSLYYPNFPFKQ